MLTNMLTGGAVFGMPALLVASPATLPAASLALPRRSASAPPPPPPPGLPPRGMLWARPRSVPPPRRGSRPAWRAEPGCGPARPSGAAGSVSLDVHMESDSPARLPARVRKQKSTLQSGSVAPGSAAVVLSRAAFVTKLASIDTEKRLLVQRPGLNMQELPTHSSQFAFHVQL